MSLRKHLPTKSLILHVFERAFVTVLFSYFAFGMLHAFLVTHSIIPLLIIVSESLPVVLIYSRPSSDTLSGNLTDWVFALVGTAAPLLTDPSAAILPTSHLLNVVLVLIVSGMCVQISAKVILWRSFGIVAANRGVKIGGPYRFVRHPMYAGYAITHVGVLLALPSLYNVLLYSGVLAIQIARLLREERILSQDPVYRDFASRVHYRLLPGVF